MIWLFRAWCSGWGFFRLIDRWTDTSICRTGTSNTSVMCSTPVERILNDGAVASRRVERDISNGDAGIFNDIKTTQGVLGGLCPTHPSLLAEHIYEQIYKNKNKKRSSVRNHNAMFCRHKGRRSETPPSVLDSIGVHHVELCNATIHHGNLDTQRTRLPTKPQRVKRMVCVPREPRPLWC